MLRGGAPEAAFWTHTFRSAEERLTDRDMATVRGTNPVTKESFEETMALLGDSSFWTPFAAVVCVTGRRSWDRE